MRLGVLALQGDHAAHARSLRRAADSAGWDCEPVLVRRPAHLEGLDGLVMPGGESTTMLKLLALENLDRALLDYAGSGGAIFGTCAGAILLAREVRNPSQPCLGLLDAVVERNAYGRQIDSVITTLRVSGDEAALGGAKLEGVFIRAPRFVRLGPEVEILAWRAEDPVLVRQGRVLAATFHPELTEDLRVSGLFLDIVADRPLAAARP